MESPWVSSLPPHLLGEAVDRWSRSQRTDTSAPSSARNLIDGTWLDEVRYPGPDDDTYHIVFTGAMGGALIDVPPEFPAVGSVAYMDNSPIGQVTKVNAYQDYIFGNKQDIVDCHVTEFVTGNLIVAKYVRRLDNGEWQLTKRVTVVHGSTGVSWT